MSKILVAMSGGVDSSVAAGLLVEQGHDVTGVHLKLSDIHPADEAGRTHGCCGLTDAEDARRVAQVLDIPFYVWNLRDLFAETVMDEFVTSYAEGRTPNPCVSCNEKIKFGGMLDRAVQLGYEAVATGHYARVEQADRPRLYRSADKAKDQSYVLARTSSERLAAATFPLGEWEKDQTREAATRMGLRTADKPESYDICFVPDGDTAGFLERTGVATQPGLIVNSAGDQVGEHGGVHRFTIGQRKGLGLASHEKAYVVGIDAPSATVTIGRKEDLEVNSISVTELNVLGELDQVTSVQVRAHGGQAPTQRVESTEGGARVLLAEPLMGVAPGQLIVMYRDDEVIAGGTITKATGQAAKSDLASADATR